MGIFADISAALDGHLNTLTNAPPIAWPNGTYTPVEGTLYLRVTHSPITAQTVTHDYAENHGGTYLVTVFAPAGKYKGEALTMADAVADHFAGTRKLTYGGVTATVRAVSTATPVREGAWFSMPVAIAYDCYATR